MARGPLASVKQQRSNALTKAPWAKTMSKPKAVEIALHVFLEGVDSSIADHVPRPREFHAVLAELCEEKVHLLKPGVDFQRKARIVAWQIGGPLTACGMQPRC